MTCSSGKYHCESHNFFNLVLFQWRITFNYYIIQSLHYKCITFDYYILNILQLIITLHVISMSVLDLIVANYI